MGVRVRYLARCAACVALTLSVTTTASAAEDPIIEWNRHAFAAFRVGSGTPAAPVPVTPLVTSRVAAIVQAAMFDAVNGVERRYSENPRCTGTRREAPPSGRRPSRRRTVRS